MPDPPYQLCVKLDRIIKQISVLTQTIPLTGLT